MNTEHPESFDVFLSHAHLDAVIVESLGARLADDAGLRIWLDKWVLVPGEHWQQAMAKGLDQASTCAVCIGNETPKGWFREEIQRALNRQTQDPSFRVIPVILPNGQPDLVDDFLELRTWVDFRSGIDDPSPFHVLVSGIKGLPPGRNPSSEVHSDDLVALRAKLTKLRILREEQLIDDVVAQDIQRRVLIEIIET
jgi:hypothetical protein